MREMHLIYLFMLFYLFAQDIKIKCSKNITYEQDNKADHNTDSCPI